MTALGRARPRMVGAPFSAMLARMEEKIRKAVEEALAKAGVGSATYTVERPSDLSHGDYATNAAMAAAKIAGRNPRELADSLVLTIQDALGADASRVEVAGPGFINITLSKAAVAFAVDEAGAQGEAWGKNEHEKGKRVLIEYSNPNAFKEMHAGHLVGTIIGESLSRLIEN